MANSFNYAEKYSPDLLEIMTQGSLTSPFITSNVAWVGANKFHFTQMGTSGFKNHSRNGGWNRGSVTQTDVVYTIAHDRDVEFLVDKADVDETNLTASIEKIYNTFYKTHAVPEADAYFFQAVSQAAIEAKLYTATATADYTVENVYGKLKAILKNNKKLKLYRSNGSLVMYVSSDIMDLLEMSKDFTRKIEMTQVAEGGQGIETRVTSIDGIPLFEVIDDLRFYTEQDYTEGFVAKKGAHKLNVCVASLETVKRVEKINSLYYFAPGAHTQGDGYLVQIRTLSDTVIIPNGLDGKVDSVFIDYDTAAVA